MVGLTWWWWLTTRGVADLLAGSPLTTFGPVSLVNDANDALMQKINPKLIQGQEANSLGFICSIFQKDFMFSSLHTNFPRV